MEIENQQIQKLLERIASLEALVAQQAEKIKELEKRLSKNSSNSSKPPSSDRFGKGNKKTSSSLREKGKHKKGGQQGHPGETLKQVEHPDNVICHDVSWCLHCDRSLKDVSSHGLVKRQVFDILPPTVVVTEHQSKIKKCPLCKENVVATFPLGVNAPTQYGPVLQSYAVYLHEQQLIPEERLQQTFSDLFNVKIATATLNRFSEIAHIHLKAFETDILSKIQQASIKHLDETGFRVAGKTYWLHVASNTQWTYYHYSNKRKSLLPELRGLVVHDHWRSYYQLEHVTHALCNAHHLRELKALMEDKERWAWQMWRFLRFALRVKHHYGEEEIPEIKKLQLLTMYDAIVQRGFYYHQQLPLYAKKPRRGRAASRPGYNLLLRLREHRAEVTRFITEVQAPFTNNLAERDLRMMKVKQKISGGFRSEQGASQFVRIRSFISTIRKQGQNVLEGLIQAVSEPVFLPTG